MDVDDANNLLKLIPQEVVNEAAIPSAKVVGQSLHGLLSTVLYPTLLLNSFIQPKIAKLNYKIEKNIAKIPEEYRDSSKPTSILKTIDDAKYNMDAEILIDMFSKLLSNQLDSRVNNAISPKFSTILGNMSTSEAKLINLLFHTEYSILPVIAVNSKYKNSNNIVKLESNIVLLNSSIEQNASMLKKQEADYDLSSLISDGIIKVDKNFELTAQKYQDSYMLFESNYEKSHPSYVDQEYSYDRGSVTFTSFGMVFAKSVIDS